MSNGLNFESNWNGRIAHYWSLALLLTIGLLPAVQAAGAHAPLAPPADYRYGDESRVDVSVKLDGVEVGGLTVQLTLDETRLFLPVLMR